MRTIDLNADLGESFGPWRMGEDEALLAVVTSANVACGFHAGDPLTLLQTVRRAAAAGVSVGAHPGYADLRGFGRREVEAPPEEIFADVLYQIGAAAAACRAAGVELRHVKPHGALYHRCVRDAAAAGAVARAAAAFGTGLQVYAPPGSALARAAVEAGLPVRREGFPDRGYLSDGRLAPRQAPGAVVADPDEAARRALRMVLEGRVPAVDGGWVELEVDTLCIHGDHPGAAARAAAVRRALEAAAVEVRA
ncbi:MAG: 5-oxoprolinase subunit PxpA [Firmicutes bacterium]|nr:5-oxoprolinase subunit PxpA [Bacillota bacterium]